ncbi:MAG: hypothetical protein ACRCV9_21035 [Burkholderiaceae bacterium]
MNDPKPLPHAEQRIEWATLEAQGYVAAGHFHLEAKVNGTWLPNPNTLWLEHMEYRIVLGPNHPDNQKPKLRLVDKSKLPRGTMTNHGEILFNYGTSMSVWREETGLKYAASDLLRIAPQERWTAWTGGECPVPDGVEVEIIFRHGESVFISDPNALAWNSRRSPENHDIIAYRISGLAESFTDDESLAA